MRKTPLRTLGALVALAFTVAACGDTGDDAAEPAREGETIAIETFIFGPDPITVAAGTQITFENLDGTTHTATAGTRGDPDPDTFDIELDGPGSTGTVTLADPGTYPYFCAIHSGGGMTGEITVE
jgi:plastocyanin